MIFKEVKFDHVKVRINLSLFLLNKKSALFARFESSSADEGHLAKLNLQKWSEEEPVEEAGYAMSHVS